MVDEGSVMQAGFTDKDMTLKSDMVDEGLVMK